MRVFRRRVVHVKPRGNEYNDGAGDNEEPERGAKEKRRYIEQDASRYRGSKALDDSVRVYTQGERISPTNK